MLFGWDVHEEKQYLESHCEYVLYYIRYRYIYIYTVYIEYTLTLRILQRHCLGLCHIEYNKNTKIKPTMPDKDIAVQKSVISQTFWKADGIPVSQT